MQEQNFCDENKGTQVPYLCLSSRSISKTDNYAKIILLTVLNNERALHSRLPLRSFFFPPSPLFIIHPSKIIHFLNFSRTNLIFIPFLIQLHYREPFLFLSLSLLLHQTTIESRYSVNNGGLISDRQLRVSQALLYIYIYINCTYSTQRQGTEDCARVERRTRAVGGKAEGGVRGSLSLLSVRSHCFHSESTSRDYLTGEIHPSEKRTGAVLLRCRVCSVPRSAPPSPSHHRGGIKVPPRKKILQGRIIIFPRKREVGGGYRPVNQHLLPSRVIISFFPIFLSFHPRSRIWYRRNAIRFDSIRFGGMTMHVIFTPRFFIYFLFYSSSPFHSYIK